MQEFIIGLIFILVIHVAELDIPILNIRMQVFLVRVVNTSHTKIIPNCRHMDPPIIDLQLGLM